MTTSLNELFGLADKVVVVTGGASGIGVGIAEVLAGADACVVIADRDIDGARAVAAKIKEGGHSGHAVEVDIAEESSVSAACATIGTEIGVPWLLVNNAAVQDREYLLQMSAAEWDRIHTVNARGTFLMTREVARSMAAAGRGGRIVNIASNAIRGGIIKGLAAYASSKGAVATLGLAAAFELAEHQITVNTVLPAAVITPGGINAKGPAIEGPAMRETPFGFQEPWQIGAAVLYFASPAARVVTNQIIAVDGGFSVS